MRSIFKLPDICPDCQSEVDDEILVGDDLLAVKMYCGRWFYLDGSFMCKDVLGKEDSDSVKLECLSVKYTKLQAIVDKLPKTKDGVSVVPGLDTVYTYCNHHHKIVSGVVIHCENRRGYEWGMINRIDERFETVHPIQPYCFSTREAAEAAKEATQ